MNDQGEGLDFTRNLTVASGRSFLRRLGRFHRGRGGTSGPIDLVTGESPEPARHDFVNGQLAFYYKGLVKGQWLLTAAADTQDQPVRDLFSNFARKDPEDLLRRIDPNRYYPVYGDDSTTVQDAPTSGKFYVRLEKGDSSVLWGNFQTQLTGTDFIQYARTLYGLDVRYRSPRPPPSARRGAASMRFWADPGTLESRQEFRGTGGSLYYLQNQDISVGPSKCGLRCATRTPASCNRSPHWCRPRTTTSTTCRDAFCCTARCRRPRTARPWCTARTRRRSGVPGHHLRICAGLLQSHLPGHRRSCQPVVRRSPAARPLELSPGDPGQEQDLRGVNGTWRYKPGTYVKAGTAPPMARARRP